MISSMVRSLAWTRGHPLAVAHDGDLVGDAQNLLHLVGDVDDAAAAVAQHVDDSETDAPPPASVKEEVGSSNTMTLALKETALAISTICRWETGRVDMMALGSTWTSSSSKTSRVSLAHLTTPLTMSTRHLGIAAQPQVIHDAAGQGLVQLLVHHGHAVFQRLF